MLVVEFHVMLTNRGFVSVYKVWNSSVVIAWAAWSFLTLGSYSLDVFYVLLTLILGWSEGKWENIIKKTHFGEAFSGFAFSALGQPD